MRAFLVLVPLLLAACAGAADDQRGELPLQVMASDNDLDRQPALVVCGTVLDTELAKPDETPAWLPPPRGDMPIPPGNSPRRATTSRC